MKPFRVPVGRLSKERLEWLIQHRKEKKRECPFGVAHFPKGTIAVFESPTQRFLKEDEREFPGQRYATFEAEVEGVVPNGPNSWAVVLKDRTAINTDWARKIIKRGEGPLRTEVNDVEDSLWKTRATHPLDPDTHLPINKHPNHYYIDSIYHFIYGKLEEVNKNNFATHLIDVDKLISLMCGDIIRQATSCGDGVYCHYLISKKKFRKIFNRCLPHARTSRRKEAERQARIEAFEYNRSFDDRYEDDYDDPEV